MYSFLYAARVSVLKGPSGPLKKHKLPQGLNKQAMVAALFQIVCKAVSDGAGELGFDDGVVFASGDAMRWLKSSQRSSLSLFKAQSDSVLEKYSPIPSRGRKRKNIRATASFTANEFARVVTILTTDQGVRRALLRSGLDLTRGELDRGVGRDDFWVQQVEPLMNDPALVFELFDHATPLSLAPNAPLSDARAGELLKQKFYEARGHFTRWYSNCNVSGNYSAENFHLFVAPPQTGSTTYPNTSLCAMILFHALRCGMKDADVEILNFVAKTAEEECVYDDATEDNSVLSSRKKNRALSLEGDANLTFLPVLRQV
jgi:hypothetical protein